MSDVRLRAVVLDMDGTLIDSEPLCAETWTAMLADHGYATTPDDLAWTVGKTFAQGRDHYAERLAESGRTLPDAMALHDDYWARLRGVFAERLRAFPDAVALVEALRERHVPMAIASNSVRERVSESLSVVGHELASIPSVAGDEVTRPKPAPDLVVAASGRLGVQAYECVVVEDSDSGEEAARTAGATVVRVDRVRAEGGDLVAEVLGLLSL
ncbi:HAD family hydrolase [Mariniluteicoccus flavus]